MPALKLPYFENEAAEAQWWYDHREEVSEQLLAALREGRNGEGTVGRHARRMREAALASVENSTEVSGSTIEETFLHTAK